MSYNHKRYQYNRKVIANKDTEKGISGTFIPKGTEGKLLGFRIDDRNAAIYWRKGGAAVHPWDDLDPVGGWRWPAKRT